MVFRLHIQSFISFSTGTKCAENENYVTIMLIIEKKTYAKIFCEIYKKKTKTQTYIYILLFKRTNCFEN